MPLTISFGGSWALKFLSDFASLRERMHVGDTERRAHNGQEWRNVI